MQMRDKFEEMHTFPKPLSEEFLESVHAWIAATGDVDEVSLVLADMHAQDEAEKEMEVL